MTFDILLGLTGMTALAVAAFLIGVRMSMLAEQNSTSDKFSMLRSLSWFGYMLAAVLFLATVITAVVVVLLPLLSGADHG